MDQKLAETIGLLRHQIISPVLMDSTQAQMAYFRQMAQRDWDVPGRGLRRFTASTMRGWLYRYRKKGFHGLVPKTRKDKGGFRALSDELKIRIRKLRQDQMGSSCVKFYDRCLQEHILGTPPVGIETLRRFLKLEGLYRTRVAQARKRFEMRYFGEMWTGDFMHGPQLPDGKRRKRAILMALIDDHSRLIVGHLWGWAEDTKLLENVFKDALLTYGLPDKLYCDNGSAFSSQYLALVCANLNIALIHSKPYDSPSRGKIERFFRTVREDFLADSNPSDINELNQVFGKWIRDVYHRRIHHGIGARPLDRLEASIRDYPRKRVSEDQLSEYFLVTAQRTVNKDSTVSLNTVAFEVPPQFIGRRVELKFSQEHPTEVFLYDNGVRIQKCLPVDTQLNGKTYQPSPRISNVALHTLKPGDSK